MEYFLITSVLMIYPKTITVIELRGTILLDFFDLNNVYIQYQ